jgi:hypothetical protein
MKDSLVNLLFEEFKQICLFEELEAKGIFLNNIAVQNLNIVIDLVGFPKDNVNEYDYHSLNGMDHNPKHGKIIDENLFIRDWLIDKFYEIVHNNEKKQKIEVTEKGLKMTEVNDEKLIRIKIGEYVDWLFKEYFELHNE